MVRGTALRPSPLPATDTARRWGPRAPDPTESRVVGVDASGGVAVALTLRNRSSFPIDGVAVVLRLEARSGSSSASTPPTATTLAAVDLPAGAAHLQTVTLHPPSCAQVRPWPRRTPVPAQSLNARASPLGQYNVRCHATFASPATGRALVAPHDFGLYVLDQCTRVHTAAAASRPAPDAEEVHAAAAAVQVPSFPAALFRELFAVAPTAGVGLGDAGRVHRAGTLDVVVRVASVAASDGILALEVVPGPDAPNDAAMPALIADELRRLAPQP